MAKKVRIVTKTPRVQVWVGGRKRFEGKLDCDALVSDSLAKLLREPGKAVELRFPAKNVKAYGVLSVTLLPSTPTGLVDISRTAHSLELAVDDPGNVLTWTFYVDGAPQPPVSIPEVIISGLEPNTFYSIQVQATNSVGSSGLSTPELISTNANTPPSWTLLQQSGVEGEPYSRDLSLDVEDIDGQPLIFAIVSGSVPGLVLNGSILSGTFTASGTFPLILDTFDGYDHAQTSVDFVVEALPDVTAPTTPELNTPVVNGSTVSVSLATASTDDSGIEGYQIWRSGDAGATFQFRITIPETSFPYIESGVPNGTWLYKCRARDDSPNENLSAFSANVQAVVSVVVDPDTPTNLTAILISEDDAEISWQAGSSGPAPIGYDLEYSIEADGGSSSGPWVDFSVPGTVTQVTQSNLPTGRTWWHVRALTESGQSNFTSPIFLDVGQSSAPADFMIAAGSSSWDGSVARPPLTGGPARAVQGGDIVEFEAGAYPHFTLLKVVGTSQNYVTVRCPSIGQVIFRRSNSGSSTSGGFAFEHRACRFVVWDGFTTDNGVPVQADGKRHGIKVTHKANATPSNKDSVTAYVKCSGQGQQSYNNTRDFIWRYIHVDGGWDLGSGSLSNNSGIAFSTNDHAYKRDDWPGQWQENMILEHCLVENVGGEGTYIGPNPYMTVRGSGAEAGGPDVPLRRQKTRDCMFKNVGGNGISYKSVYDGEPGGDEADSNSVHHCVLIACGLYPEGNGIAAATFNSARFAIYNNWFEDCGSTAISLRLVEGTSVGFPGPTPTLPEVVFNNVIKNCGVSDINDAIKTLSFPSEPASYKVRVRIFCNTILNHAGTAINAGAAHTSDGFIRHNLCPNETINYGPLPSSSTNVTSGTPANTFVDAVGTYLGENLDLRPQNAVAASGTIGVGTVGQWSLNVDTPNFDFADIARNSGNANIGAYQA